MNSAEALNFAVEMRDKLSYRLECALNVPARSYYEKQCEMLTCLINVAREQEQSQWISVKERLPEPFVSVLVQMPGENPCPTVREGFITRDGIWHSALYDREPDEVTHWRPMPEPPKEGADG